MEHMEQPSTNPYIICVYGVPISCELMENYGNISHFLATYR